MMFAPITAPHYVGILPTVACQTARGFMGSSRSFGQIFAAAYPPLQSLGILSYGIKELVLDVLIPRCKEKKPEALSLAEQKIQQTVQDSLPHLARPQVAGGNMTSQKELILHGSLFVHSGVFGLAEQVRRRSWVSFGFFGRILDPLSRLYFLLGNLLSLCQAVARLKRERAESRSGNSAFTPSQLKRMLHSAIIGMIAAIDYILMTLIPLLGFSTGIIFFMAGVAAFTGSLQVIYDLFFLPKGAF